MKYRKRGRGEKKEKKRRERKNVMFKDLYSKNTEIVESSNGKLI